MTDSIDRLTPTLPPVGSPFFHQNWKDLLFLHWEVPFDQLRSLVPLPLSIDQFQGKAWVTLLPFTLTGVRPMGLPSLPVVSDFHEVNLRTYVHFEGRDPGVWFFSLDASSRLAVAAARATYHLPYHAAQIHFRAEGTESRSILFTSHRAGKAPVSCQVKYRGEGPVRQASEGSLEFFLVERYVLYSQWNGHLYRARVHHQPYPMQSAQAEGLEQTITWAAGLRLGPEAPLAHYASEVNVDIYPLELVAG